MKSDIKVIIPAFNEAKSIAEVVDGIPDSVSEIIVVNNNSSDKTFEKEGAMVMPALKEWTTWPGNPNPPILSYLSMGTIPIIPKNSTRW
jgi:glycosyltransferase involved in cell wall biosynthesis